MKRIAVSTAYLMAGLAEAAPEVKVGSASAVWEMLWGLIAVLALALAAAWIVRKTRMLPGGSTSAIKVVAQQWLSTRERLMLVQVGSEQVLIGVSPQGMVALHKLKEPVPEQEVSGGSSGLRFSAELKRVMSRRGPQPSESDS